MALGLAHRDLYTPRGAGEGRAALGPPPLVHAPSHVASGAEDPFGGLGPDVAAAASVDQGA